MMRCWVSFKWKFCHQIKHDDATVEKNTIAFHRHQSGNYECYPTNLVVKGKMFCPENSKWYVWSTVTWNGNFLCLGVKIEFFLFLTQIFLVLKFFSRNCVHINTWSSIRWLLGFSALKIIAYKTIVTTTYVIQGKVMFSCVSVLLFTGGGRRGGLPWPGDPTPPWARYGREGPWAGDPTPTPLSLSLV